MRPDGDAVGASLRMPLASREGCGEEEEEEEKSREEERGERGDGETSHTKAGPAPIGRTRQVDAVWSARHACTACSKTNCGLRGRGGDANGTSLLVHSVAVPQLSPLLLGLGKRSIFDQDNNNQPQPQPINRPIVLQLASTGAQPIVTIPKLHE